jgi:hypothetical protein
MQSFILGISGKTVTGDHRNWNTLDNRKANLRISSQSEQVHHRRYPKGYSKNKQGKYWARMTVSRKYVALGVFATEEEAREAYLAASRTQYPEIYD